MSVTGTQVITRLQQFHDDSSDATFSAAKKLEAINAAIDEAFPQIANVKVDSSITLASTTFEYTPTATPEIEQGFAGAYVTPFSTTDEPKIRLTQVRQRLSTTTWTIIVPRTITEEWNGKTLHVEYNSRVARITAAGDSIELPMDYLFAYASWWLSFSTYLTDANFDVDVYGKVLTPMEKIWRERRAAGHRGLPSGMPIVYQHGGAGVIPEPSNQVDNVRV